MAFAVVPGQPAPDAVAAEDVQTIGIIGGPVRSSGLHHLAELSAAVQDDGLRIVPIAGRGPLQNLNDLLTIKGTDAAVVQTDVFEHAARNKLVAELLEKFSYLTTLQPSSFHLLVRHEQTSLDTLNGRRINTGLPGSGFQVTAQAVLEAAGVGFTATEFDATTAIAKLKTGEIDAMVYIDSAPSRLLETITEADGLKLMPVPYSVQMARHYQPAWLQQADYAGLIAPGRTVETVAVGTALIGYNWPVRSKGHDRLADLVKAMAANLDQLRSKPNHAAWRSVALSAQLPGFERHRAATAALAEAGTARVSNDRLHKLRTQFKALLVEPQRRDGQ